MSANTRATVSYVQYRCLEQGMRAQDVQASLGVPDKILEAEGIVRFLSYRCANANGKVGSLRLAFDEKGLLETIALFDPDAPAPAASPAPSTPPAAPPAAEPAPAAR